MVSWADSPSADRAMTKRTGCRMSQSTGTGFGTGMSRSLLWINSDLGDAV